MKHARITLAAVLAVLAGLVGLAAGTGAASAKAAATNTTLTLTIANCEGCVVGLTSVMAADYEDLWSSKEKKVKSGEVTFKVPIDRTAGLSIGVSPPWEGAVPYQTMVALRYKGYTAGEKAVLLRHQPRQEGLGLLGRHDRRRRHAEDRRQEGHRHGQHGPGEGLDRLRQDHAGLPAADAAHLERRARLPGRLRLRPRGLTSADLRSRTFARP